MRDVDTEARDYLVRIAGLRGHSDHTIKAYRSDLRDYANFLRARELKPKAKDAIVAYAAHLTKTRKPRTVRRRLVCLRGFYKDLVRQKAIAESPFDGLDLQIPRGRSLPRALSRDDARRLAHAAWGLCRPNSERAFGVGVLIALSVGLRVSEITGLRCGDYDPTRGALRVRGKGSRDRTVFVVDVKLRALVSGLASRPDPTSTLLLTTSGSSWSTERFRARLALLARGARVSRHVTPHMLRHTAATLLLEDGVDVLFLQRLLGHQDISTTALYAHVAETSLMRALQKASLLASLGRRQVQAG